MANIKKKLSMFFPFISKVHLRLFDIRRNWLLKQNPRKLAALYYQGVMKQKMDWENPKDLNAKIQWLKFNGDRELWARCSDKYAVREYVKERGLESILVDLYGKWDTVEDIDFSSLPEVFIIKINTGSGGNYICKDKSQLDEKKVKAFFNHWFNVEYSDMFVEPHYQLIKPCIIAEELLDSSLQDIKSTSLVDYKVWCFNGEPLFTYVIHNREHDGAQVAVYDYEWNNRPEYCVFTPLLKESKCSVPKPSCYVQMMEAASILSKGHPEVRVDFYVVNNKLYFGEMTFTAFGGYIDYYSREVLNKMGEKTDLSLVRRYDGKRN